MSLFGKLFGGGGGKGGKAPTPQEAIQKLRETEEMLAKKQDFLEKKIDTELMTAKKNGTKNKRGEETKTKKKPEVCAVERSLVCELLAPRANDTR